MGSWSRFCTTKHPRESTAEYIQWPQCNKLARAIIKQALSADMLEHIRDVPSAKQMYEIICNIFQRHMLLNKLRARRNFYTVMMSPEEKFLTYMNGVQQLGQVLKAMEAKIDDKKNAMAILTGCLLGMNPSSRH